MAQKEDDNVRNNFERHNLGNTDICLINEFVHFANYQYNYHAW